MSYTGIGATDPNHPLEVEGQVFISNVEAGSASQDVPFEVYSDYTGNSGLTDSRQLRLRVTPSATTTTNVHVDMGINNTDGDYFFISEPVTGATTVGTKSTFTINQDGNVGVGSNLSVTGNVVTSNIVGGSPLTISTGSNVQILTSNVGIGTVVDPVSNTRVHIQGGSHASITNANVFPNFIFSRNVDATKKHVGGSHNAALQSMLPDDTGKVWAAGDGNEGATGLGDTTDRNVYTLVSALDGVANIRASSTHAYSGGGYNTTGLIDDTGNVWTCGYNGVGNLGHGDEKARRIPTLVSNSNIYNMSVTEIAMAGICSLILNSDGEMWGCGWNNDYRLGNMSSLGTGSISTFLPTYPGASAADHTFTSIAQGEAVSYALQDNGRVWSTGSNGYGRTGQGTTVGNTGGWTLCPDGTTTGPALSEVTIDQICSAENSAILKDTTGNVWVTGENANGALGLGDTTNRLYFERVTTNVNVLSGVTAYKIAGCHARLFVLDTAGRIWGSGWNSNGNIGNPPYIAGPVTTFIRADAGPIANKSITDFALPGVAAAIVRTSDNEYYVTGYNNAGQLGVGDTQDRFVYTKILDVNANPPPDYGYTRSLLLENTETGKGPSIELKNSDAVSSRIQMEDGASGKLNIGFVDASFDPKLSGGDGAELYPFQERAQSNTMTRGVTINQAGGTMVAGGSTSNIGFNTPVFTCGLPGNNMYGYADPGQLGLGYGTQLFMTTEGKVYVAGDNIDGAAGNGTTSNVLEWTESTPPTTYGKIKAFAFGVKYSFAITDQAYIYRAGNNGAGQLGLNDTTNRTTWTTDTARLISISGGSSHTLGISSSESKIYAAGIGSNYALGTGTTSNQNDFVLSESGAMASGATAKWVCAGRRQSYAIRSDDALVFVGNNGQGVAGDGGTANKTTWTVIASSNFDSKTPRAVYLAGKADLTESAMMITTEGKIYGTGNNDKGQLGVGDTTDKTTWTAATGDIASQTVTRLACSDRATFALDSTGNVWSCGNSVFVGQGLSDDDTDLTTFTKITKPTEFLSKTIVNIVGLMQGLYAVDSEGNLWGTGVLMGLGTAGVNANQQFSFTKVPIYDVVPKEFKYTPTLTLENPNPDYGATVEFKNPNNRAFINLDDKTSNLRLGFVNNEDNAGQFKGISISPSDNSVYFNQGLNLDAPGDEGINFRVPSVAVVDTYDAISKFIGIRDSSGAKMAGIDFTGENDGQKISFYTHDSGVSIGTRMTIYQNGIMQCLNPNARFVNGDATSAASYGWYTRWNARVPGLGRFEIINQRGGGPGGIEFGNHQTGGFTTFGDWCPLYAASFNVVSDFRLKRDIQTIENGLDTISRLNPTTFETNMSNEGDDYVRKSGFIAQEVYYDTPELRHALTMPHDAQSDIETNRLPNYENWGNDRASMELAPIIPYLVKAVQELKARVEALENA